MAGRSLKQTMLPWCWGNFTLTLLFWVALIWMNVQQPHVTTSLEWCDAGRHWGNWLAIGAKRYVSNFSLTKTIQNQSRPIVTLSEVVRLVTLRVVKARQWNIHHLFRILLDTGWSAIPGHHKTMSGYEWIWVASLATTYRCMVARVYQFITTNIPPQKKIQMVPPSSKLVYKLHELQLCKLYIYHEP